MAATVLYRKWRPQRFADVVGQDPIIRTLKNAVAHDKIAHAYLFSGPRGTGKTTTGRLLAKAINVPTDDDGEPLDTPEARQFDSSLDLVEIDAASNRGIDNIRDLRERANYAPASFPYKVYLIDEVHQLTDAAADALLKTLEEPPPHVVFILATTDPEQLKPTILSRCQRFDFRRVAVDDLVTRLRHIAAAEGLTAPDDALALIARAATGSARDAVNLLDQIWATYGATFTADDVTAALGLTTDTRALDLARAALTRDLPAGLATLAAVQDDAADLGRFQRQVVQHLRHALLLQSDAAGALALSDTEQDQLRALVDGVSPADTVAALRAFSEADLRADPFLALPLELALARLVFRDELEPKPAPAPRASAGQRGARGGGQRGGGQRGAGPRTDQRAPGPRQGASAGSRQPAPRNGPRRQPPPARRQGPTPPEPARTAPAPSAAEGRRPAPPPAERSPADQLLYDIREELKRTGQQKLVALLNGSCTIPDPDADELVLAFLPMYVDFHKSKVEESIALVAAAAEAVRGRPTTVRCTEADDPAPRGSSLVAEAERLGARRVR